MDEKLDCDQLADEASCSGSTLFSKEGRTFRQYAHISSNKVLIYLAVLGL